MWWRWLVAPLLAAVGTVSLAAPVLAHGDHDAHALARDITAGPYLVSLWQVYPDTGDAMEPRLIVMVDAGGAAAPVTDVAVTVGSTEMGVTPSTTTANGWETDGGVVAGDVITVTLSDGTDAWRLDPVVVGQAAASMLPMPLLIYVSSALTAVTALWVVSRTFRAWRRPTLSTDLARHPTQGGSS